MYLTIKETAEYLELPQPVIEQFIKEKKIKALFDGEQYLINKEQFNQHLEQMDKLRRQMEEEASEQIPEDYDYKDED